MARCHDVFTTPLITKQRYREIWEYMQMIYNFANLNYTCGIYNITAFIFFINSRCIIMSNHHRVMQYDIVLELN